MHIAINGWFWDQPYTGSGQYIRNLLVHLSQLESSLRLSLVLPPHIPHPDALPDGVEVVHTPRSVKSNLGKVMFEQRAYPKIVRQLGANIAHVPYWGTPLNTKPARLVTSVLDIIPLVMPAYRGGVGATLYTSLVAASAKGSAHIITLSEASKSDIVTHLNILSERITTTYLAADDRFRPQSDPHEDETVRKKYHLPDEFALYLGGFDVRKNVNQLFLAWTYAGPSLGEQVPLVVAGKQPHTWGTPRFPDFPDYAKKLNIEKYLHWTGEIDEADKPALYRLAKLFVFPSKYEGFGLPVLEAMASGVPVVACQVSSIPEVAGDAAYLVPVDDARQMGAAILSILVQEDLRANLINAGRGQASKFSWRKTAQKTLEVYEKVMRESA
jgi:glycosyltransferase involved in cell wall biosynthesis